MMLLFGAGTIVAPVMTIAVAEVSYRLLERPVLRRGRARPRGAGDGSHVAGARIAGIRPVALPGESS